VRVLVIPGESEPSGRGGSALSGGFRFRVGLPPNMDVSLIGRAASAKPPWAKQGDVLEIPAV